MNSYVSWTLLTLGMAGVVATMVGVFLSKITTQQAWVVMAGSVALVVVTQLHRVKEFSFGPAAAKLDEKVAEADATLAELREAMATFSDTVLTVSIANDFFDDLPTRKRFELHGRVMDSLRDLNLTRAQLNKADSGWRQGLGIMHHRVFSNVLTEQLASSDKSREEQRAIVRRLWDLGDYNTWTSPSPGELRNFFKREGVLSPELEQWLGDYEHFLATGELRRRDSFLYEASEKQRSKD